MSSGLGIDFSPASKLWDEALAPSPSVQEATPHMTFAPNPQRKMSRWSESTKTTGFTCPTSDYSPMSGPGFNSLHGSGFSRRRSTTFESEPASQDEYGFAITSNAHGRGSEDSQASYGPETPLDDGGDFHTLQITHLGPLQKVHTKEEFVQAPRRAPLPPTIPEGTLTPEGRRPSIAQNMMRSWSTRKKDLAIPAPLNLAPPVPTVPASFAFEETTKSPIPSQRKGSKSRRPSSPSISKVNSPRRESMSKASKRLGSFSSVVKSIRKSISGDSRKGSVASRLVSSPILNASLGSPQAQNSPISVSHSPSLRKARQQNNPSVSKSYDFTFNRSPIMRDSAASYSPVQNTQSNRPGTAPANQSDFPRNAQQIIASYAHSSRAPSISSPKPSPSHHTVSPRPSLRRNDSSPAFKIAYANPWATNSISATFTQAASTFTPDAAYLNGCETPLSPGAPLPFVPEEPAETPARSDADKYKDSIRKRDESTDKGKKRDEEGSDLMNFPTFSTVHTLPSRPNQGLGVSAPSWRTVQQVDPIPVPTAMFNQGPASPTPSVLKSPRAKASKRIPPPSTKGLYTETYIETPGGMTVRNPFAADQSPTIPSACSSIDPGRRNNKKEKSSDQKSNASLAAEPQPKSPEEIPLTMMFSAKPASEQFSPDSSSASPHPREAASPPMLPPVHMNLSPNIQKTLDDMLIVEDAEAPRFYNPFLARLSEPNILQVETAAVSVSEKAGRTKRTGSAQTQSSGRRRSSSAQKQKRPSFIDGPSGSDTTISTSSTKIVKRKASVADLAAKYQAGEDDDSRYRALLAAAIPSPIVNEARRPSEAVSLASQSNFPALPTQLQVRRETEVDGRKGLRVSLDGLL